jgi:hypothetical protein
MGSVTDKQAFLAMVAFLQDHYERTGSDDVGGLLGGLSMLPDGSTADPAAWQDWLKALHKCKAGKVNAQLRLKK